MRVLVLGAGGPAGVNTIHALQAAGHEVSGWDANPAHYPWIEATGAEVIAAESYLAAGDYDLFVPQADPLVLELAQHRDILDGATVLPATGTILVCQDKFETGWRWARGRLRSPVHRLDGPGDVPDAFDLLGAPLWLRATRGAGARGATVAETTGVAVAWLEYWALRQPDWEFVAEEYLPGRDYAWCGVYHHGQLLASFARERLEYIYPNLAPSGRTGTPTIARVVHDDRVNEIAEFAVEMIDLDWHGVACVDLREDSDGVPRPTEINAGRTCTTVPLYHEVGLNVPAIIAALGGFNELWAAGVDNCHPVRDRIPEGTTLSRHIDCGHIFTRVPVYA